MDEKQKEKEFQQAERKRKRIKIIIILVGILAAILLVIGLAYHDTKTDRSSRYRAGKRMSRNVDIHKKNASSDSSISDSNSDNSDSSQQAKPKPVSNKMAQEIFNKANAKNKTKGFKESNSELVFNPQTNTIYFEFGRVISLERMSQQLIKQHKMSKQYAKQVNPYNTKLNDYIRDTFISFNKIDKNLIMKERFRGYNFSYTKLGIGYQQVNKLHSKYAKNLK